MSSNDSEPNSGPMLGALLRIAHAAMVDEYTRWLADSQYRDIQPAHAAAIQPLWERPEGIRLTTLAQTAGGSYHPVSDAAELNDVAGFIDLRLTVATEQVPLAGAFIGLALLLLGAGAVVTVVRTGRLV